MGKITVVKNYTLPKLIYALSSLPNPPIETVKRIEKRMYEFIWVGKPEKIKRDILTMGYENGGLKMIDIDNFIKALKVCWIKRMIEADNDSILNRILIYNLRAFGGNLLFECNISENDICKFTQNIFLKDVLSAWCKCTAMQ